MTFLLALEQVEPQDRDRVGGKAYSLSRMTRQGMPVPAALVVTVEAYRRFILRTGIGEAIALEINRKITDQMRWEELWDAALRIRNLFLRTPLARRDPGGARPRNRVTILRHPRRRALVCSRRGFGKGLLRRASRVLRERPGNGIDPRPHSPRLGLAVVRCGAALQKRAGAGHRQEHHGGHRPGDRRGRVLRRGLQREPREPLPVRHRGRPRSQPGARRRHRGAGPLDPRPQDGTSANPSTRAEGEGRLCLGIGRGNSSPACRSRDRRLRWPRRRWRGSIETVLRVERFFGSPQDMEWTIRQGGSAFSRRGPSPREGLPSAATRGPGTSR